MPSRNILGVLIICLGIIASVIIFSRATPTDLKKSNISAILNANNNHIADWQNILGNSTSSEKTIILVSDETATTTDDGTLTGQLAKDFMAQYLIIKNQKGTVTEDDIAQITQNTLSATNYTDATGVQYTEKDLIISQKSDVQTVETYKIALMQIMQKRSTEKYGDVQTIVEKASQTGLESDLAKLDPIITNLSSMITDMKRVSIPNDAVDLHLALINSLSNVLSNVQSLRQLAKDPVKSFAGLSQYDQHTQDLTSAIKDLGIYFESKK